MRTKVICFLVFMFSALFIPFNVKASCDYQTKADLMKMASNVQINSSYVLNENNVPIFSIELSNITPEIFIRDNRSNLITFDSNKVFQEYSGFSLTYTIYSGHPNCYGEKLNTKYVKLTSYNKFYNTEECRQNPEFVYCKLWYNADFTVDYFRKSLSKYKNQKNASQIEQTEEGNSYLIYFSSVIGLLTLVIIIIVIRRKKYGW